VLKVRKLGQSRSDGGMLVGGFRREVLRRRLRRIRDGASDGLVHHLVPVVWLRAVVVAGQGVAASDVARPETGQRIFRMGPTVVTRRPWGRLGKSW